MQQKAQKFKVVFFRPNGTPVDVSYTMENRQEAENFAREVCNADKQLRAQVLPV